jgi:hypothetical protein
MEIASRRTSVIALAGWALLLALGSAVFGASCRRAGRPGESSAPPAQPAVFAVTGRVTDEADHAVPDARVLLVGPNPATEHREGRSDLAGRFAFEGVPRGRYSLVVEAVGLTPSEHPDVAIPGGTVVVRLAGQGRSLSGLVVYAGVGVAGARVRIGSAGGALARTTTSDGQGRFIFHGLGAGPYALRATKGLLASPILAEVTTQDEAGAGRDAGAAPPPLELATGLGVEGSVVDDLGRPLARAEVRAEASPDDPLADTALARPDGRFQLGPLPPGRYRLVARAPGHLLRSPVPVTLAPPIGQELVRQGAGRAATSPRIELVRAASAEGHVVDGRGAAVAGAQIRAGGGGAGLTDLAVIFEPLPLAAEAAASLPGARHGGPGASKVAHSDAAGAFRLDDLLPGPIHLAITHPPFAPFETETTSLAPGEHRDLGQLTLREVQGPVGLDAGAAPAAPLADPAGTASLSGIARDSGKRPLARARVRAWTGPAAPGATPLATTVTDAGGHFSLAHVPSAALVVELDHPSYPVTRATATPGAPLELIVPVPGGIDGELREQVTGAGVGKATIEAIGPGGQRASTSAKKGAFRLMRLSPGHWTLTARAPGYRPRVRDVDVPESQFLGETSVRGLRIELGVDR